jgi:hypothetical protein
MNRLEKIKFLNEIKQGKRKVKNGILIVNDLNCEPGFYNYDDPALDGEKRVISRAELERIGEFYEKVITMTRYKEKVIPDEVPGTTTIVTTSEEAENTFIEFLKDKPINN